MTGEGSRGARLPERSGGRFVRTGRATPASPLRGDPNLRPAPSPDSTRKREQGMRPALRDGRGAQGRRYARGARCLPPQHGRARQASHPQEDVAGSVTIVGARQASPSRPERTDTSSCRSILSPVATQGQGAEARAVKSRHRSPVGEVDAPSLARLADREGPWWRELVTFPRLCVSETPSPSSRATTEGRERPDDRHPHRATAIRLGALTRHPTTVMRTSG